jgi:hypothetical protein
VGRFEQLSFQMHLQGSDERGFYKPFPHDWTQDIKFAERFARTLMARGAGFRLSDPAPRTFGGYSAHGAVCGKTSRVYVDIRQWAAAKGWSVEQNDELAYLMLRRGSRYIVVPAGAGKVKVDGTWRELPDLTAQKSGRWLAPESTMTGFN